MKEHHDDQQRRGGPRGFPLSHITLSTSFNAGAGGGACGPYILPMCFQTDQQVPLILQIPNVAGSGVTTPQCRIAGPNPDFSFQWQPDSDDGGYLAQVTVAATRLYSDKPADRAALRQSFAAFREALDRLEQGSQCLVPGGAAVIANRIAASLPLRLDEMLYYYYGFDANTRAIDLHPGMRLAVDTGTYQFVAPPTQPGAGADRFVSRGRVTYEITASTDQTLSFNAYLQGIRPYQVCPTGSPLGGLADLFAACGENGGSAATYIRRYYRLIYPNQFSSPSAAAAQVEIGENVTLIGANTLTELNQATTVYVASKTCACGPGSSVVCLSFSGRASVVPEIPVVVQGRTHYVPVGTTFQDVLDTLVQVPPDVIARIVPSQIRVWRYSLGALCGDSAQSFSQSSLDFEPSTVFVPAGGGRMTQFDVPLIQGDAVRIDLSQQQPLYVASTNPFGGDPGSPVGPYLMPSGLQPGKATQFTLAVPGVAGPGASAKSCAVANNPDFALAWQPSSDGRGYLASVTVQMANVWTDDPAKRARLKQSFAGFRVALDQMALSGNCLIPGGAALIAAQTAAALPLRLDELLYYWHSFDSAARSIDLRAGMRIAVEAGAYQFCAPGAQPGSAANGYTPQAAVTYDLVRDAAQRVTFSPFIRGINPYQVTASGEQAAGLIDLAEPGSARHYYRLVYPAAMPAANASPVPPAASANSVVLLGADALADLNSATAALLKGEALPVASPAILSRYFTGRAAVVPQVQVKIQGELQYVAVGTTLRQVIDRYAVLARDEVYAFAARGHNPVLQRYALPSLQNSGSRDFAAYPIQFQRQTVPVGSGGLTQWDVPLMMGDIIQWQWSS